MYQKNNRKRLKKTKTSSQLLSIPPGKAGTLATLKIMRKLVRRYKKAMPIRELALSLSKNSRQKNYINEVKKIHAFVRDNIRYIKDIRGVETLQTPLKTMELGQGDCDDKSTLAASLLESIGHPTRLVAVGFSPGKFAHVYIDTLIGNKWISLETTEPWPLGKSAKGAVETMIVYN